MFTRYLFRIQVFILLLSITLSACVDDHSAKNNDSSINLGWTAPTIRENGAVLSLSEIAGYLILYGNTAGSYQNLISVNDPTSTGYSITGLSPGTYFIVIKTRDTSDQISDESIMVSITL